MRGKTVQNNDTKKVLAGSYFCIHSHWHSLFVSLTLFLLLFFPLSTLFIVFDFNVFCLSFLMLFFCIQYPIFWYPTAYSSPNRTMQFLFWFCAFKCPFFHFSFYALEYNGSYFLNDTARVAHWIVHLAQFIYGAQYRYHWQFVVRLIEFDIIFINKIKQINFKLTDFVCSFVYLINILRSFCGTVHTDM